MNGNDLIVKTSILITGFQGYGARAINPAEEVAKALDNQQIGPARVQSRILPVANSTLGANIQSLIEELQPRIVICLGLWPGEPTIRVERVGVNISAFEIPDNEGALVNGPVIDGGPVARQSGLPVERIVRTLLDADIPARPSSTAGNFLCNALMYHTLNVTEKIDTSIKAGFIHLPYLPLQVADMMTALGKEAVLELHQRIDLCSMVLDMQIDAIRTVCEVSLEADT